MVCFTIRALVLHYLTPRVPLRRDTVRGRELVYAAVLRHPVDRAILNFQAAEGEASIHLWAASREAACVGEDLCWDRDLYVQTFAGPESCDPTWVTGTARLFCVCFCSQEYVSGVSAVLR